MAERLCGYEPCHCEPAPGSKHCGDACAASDVPGLAAPASEACPCGHPDCRPENVPPDQPSPIAQPTSPEPETGRR